ncbi:MAG: hypothetical protein RIS47_1141 [Bacteroidota bacterium]|jgi:hypothetical protein
MKKAIVIILGVLLTLGMQAQNLKRFADKSGVIEFVYSGSTTGTEIWKWNDWGANEYHITNTEIKVFGFKQKSTVHMLRVGLDVYTWNEGETQGTVTHDEIIEDLANSTKDWESFGKKAMANLQYERKGTEMVDGKMCEIWEGPMGKIWAYKSYSLKSLINLMGREVGLTVSRFGAGEAVPVSVFTVPSKIKFKKVDQMAPENQENMTDEEREEMENAKGAIKGILKGLGN